MSEEPIGPIPPVQFSAIEPPVEAPPSGDFSSEHVTQPPDEKKGGQAKKAASGILAALAALGAKLKAVGAVLLTALKYAKLGKILLTGSTMLVSIWFYALMFGWPFGIGFVVCILVHELGHVVAGYAQGIPMSAPVFLPGMGAIILNKRGASTPFGGAIVGIAGPIGGTIAGLACVAIYAGTGNPFFLALAYVTFFMNLFNMTPVMPLDGGWITAAVSPILWVGGLVILIAMTVTGNLRNPMVFVLVILSLPRMFNEYQRIRHRIPHPTPPVQRVQMGLAYIALLAFLLVATSASLTTLENRLKVQKGRSSVQFVQRGGQGAASDIRAERFKTS